MSVSSDPTLAPPEGEERGRSPGEPIATWSSRDSQVHECLEAQSRRESLEWCVIGPRRRRGCASQPTLIRFAVGPKTQETSGSRRIGSGSGLT